MKTVSSYGVEIKKQNIPLHQTLRIYRQAVSYLTKVYHEVWEGLSEIENTQKRNILYIIQRKMWPDLISTSVLLKCHLT